MCGLMQDLELEECADFAGGADVVAKLLGHLRVMPMPVFRAAPVWWLLPHDFGLEIIQQRDVLH